MPKVTKTPRMQITIGLDFEVLARLREMAEKKGTTVTKLIEEIVVEKVQEGINKIKGGS